MSARDTERLEKMSTRPSLGPPTHGDSERTPPRGGGPVGTVFRGVTGTLGAGFLVLAATLTGVQFWGLANGNIGPGWGLVCGHWVSALVALFLQVRADRARGSAGGFQALGAALIVLASLTYWWWL